jgi:hypothetical protein
MTIPVDKGIAEIETVEAVSYENADGTLYGYANHKDWAGNPGTVLVRFMRERDYQALTAAQADLQATAELAGSCADEVLLLRQQLTASGEALRRYGWHGGGSPMCERVKGSSYPCTCGLDAALEKANGK